MSTTISPLQEVERAVQERAKAVSLDMGAPEAATQLRTLVDEEVARWSEEYKRGLRSFDIADQAIVAERAYRNVAGYGPLEPLLVDDDVWEIMVNGPDAIFVKRHTGPSGYHDEVFHDDEHVIRILTKILDDASGSHRKLDPTEGLQDAQLETGARLHIVHGDVGRDGHLLVNIRKFTGVAFRSLEELVERDMLDHKVAAFLRACVQARLSMVVAGAPGAGKTTLMSCCAAELDPSLRVVIAEEVFEADVPLPNVASMQTRPPRADRKEVDLRRLVAGFLRMAPDVAIVGEVRDREALPLLLTLSSGVKGFTTIHAGSARQALTRLRFICQLADTGSELSMSALNSLVSEAVDIVVHCTRTGDRVQVSEVIAVEDLQTGRESTAFTVTELFRRATAGAPLTWTGNLPSRAARPLEMAGYDVRRLLHASAAPFGVADDPAPPAVPAADPAPPPPPTPAPPPAEAPPAEAVPPNARQAGARAIRTRRLGRQPSR
jgi:pilus assembly protein CpaF